MKSILAHIIKRSRKLTRRRFNTTPRTEKEKVDVILMDSFLKGITWQFDNTAKNGRGFLPSIYTNGGYRFYFDSDNRIFICHYLKVSETPAFSGFVEELRKLNISAVFIITERAVDITFLLGQPFRGRPPVILGYA